MKYDTEYEAFLAYAKCFPNNSTFLVDTYDTLKSGIPHAIQVFQEMRDKGIKSKRYGIRLDSGDLAYLSKKARKMLDDAGFPDAIISASSDLDEYLIDSLMTQGAKITSWGVGTNLITSKDCPAFGGVYKLAAAGSLTAPDLLTPRIKLSENVTKITNPGFKTPWRLFETESGMAIADVITLADEKHPGLSIYKIVNPFEIFTSPKFFVFD